MTAKASQLSHALSLATFFRDLHEIELPMLGTWCVASSGMTLSTASWVHSPCQAAYM